jgi:cytochrome oxidase Cu insertion factor (SCO1/SenC/PrrC family)
VGVHRRDRVVLRYRVCRVVENFRAADDGRLAMKFTPALLFFVTLGLVFASGFFGWQAFHHAAGVDGLRAAENGGDDSGSLDRRKLDGNPAIPAFKLTRENGKEFDSKSMLGKVWVASYFFCNCPGPCYRLNQALAAIQAEPDFNDVQFVSITCDPDNDTPDELREYAKRFSADPKRWTFLTGAEKELIKVGNGSFAVPVASKTHSELAVVLDRNSTIRGYFHLTDEDDVKAIRKRLLHLLKEKAEPAKDAKP